MIRDYLHIYITLSKAKGIENIRNVLQIQN